jgi:hypothetical protein
LRKQRGRQLEVRYYQNGIGQRNENFLKEFHRHFSNSNRRIAIFVEPSLSAVYSSSMAIVNPGKTFAFMPTIWFER